MPKFRLISIHLIAATLLASVVLPSAHADLTNGNFGTNGGSGQLTVNTTLANWTGGGKEGNFGSQTTPPVFVFSPGTISQLRVTGVGGDAFMGTVKFYGAGSPPDFGTGAVVAAAGDPDYAGSISQSVTGLSIGSAYQLGFYWAGTQQQGYSGPTTAQWQVTFGGSTVSTALANTPNQGWTGWQSAMLNFTATSSSQLLTFKAVGSPSGSQPWLLLDGVALTAVAAAPEPGTLALLAVGALGGLAVWRRRQTAGDA